MNIYDTWYEKQTDKVLDVFQTTPDNSAAPVVDVVPDRADKTAPILKTVDRIMDMLRGASLLGIVWGIAYQDIPTIACFVGAILISLLSQRLCR